MPLILDFGNEVFASSHSFMFLLYMWKVMWMIVLFSLSLIYIHSYVGLSLWRERLFIHSPPRFVVFWKLVYICSIPFSSLLDICFCFYFFLACLNSILFSLVWFIGLVILHMIVKLVEKLPVKAVILLWCHLNQRMCGFWM